MLTDGSYWLGIHDGDPRATAIYLRHYSAHKSRRGARRASHARLERFMGPGEHMVLLTADCAALFGWRRVGYRADGQLGVECSIFRNEGPLASSVLIREAACLAWQRWGPVRLFTYVNPAAIRSSNPGYCFIRAGWRRLKARSASGLRILECYPDA